MKVMLTGGAGYIGTHTAVAFVEAGHEVCIVDNYSNSSKEAVRRVERIVRREINTYEVDCCDLTSLGFVMAKERPDCIIHLAGYKVAGESIEKPLEYYRNNIDSALTILEAMKLYSVKRLVFSSSAAVYGDENITPNTEDMPRGRCVTPYGWTKSMIEQILEDAVKADPSISVAILRYFNPVGAHESGLIGEDFKEVPTNIMPCIMQVASGKRDGLTVYGGDYDTPDGSCRRDFIHVMDLAEGHVKAAEYISDITKPRMGSEIFNLGTGRPYSVIELIDTFGRECGVHVDYNIGDRREGDIADSYADPRKAEALLGWRARRSIEDMCRDSWKWQVNNPEGYSILETDEEGVEEEEVEESYGEEYRFNLF